MTMIYFIAALFAFADLVSGQTVPRLSIDEQNIRKLVERFANARNAHDGSMAAQTYCEDGEYIDALGSAVRGRAALEKHWSGLGQVPRVIKHIEMISPNIALATVE